MKYGLKQLRKDFPNDQKCLQFAFDTLHSRECSCGGVYKRVANRNAFYCTKCRKQVHPLAQTIFRRSLVPLRDWFRAIVMVEDGASIKDIQEMCGSTYKTCQRMKKLIISLQSVPLKKGRLGLFVRAVSVKTKRQVTIVA